MHDSMRSGGDSPAAVEETPAEPAEPTPTPESPSEQPAPAVPSEPSTDAVPSDAPVEPPPEQPSPASEAEASYEAALARHGGDKEKLAKAYFRADSELAKVRRAEKAKPVPAVAEPVAAAPVPPAVPPPAPTTARTPEPPAAPAPEPVDLEQRVAQFAESDSVCRAVTEQFNAKVRELQDVAVLDRDGRTVGGRLFEVEQLIADASRLISGPSERLKKMGVEVPELDALARQELQTTLQSLKIEKFELVDRYNEGKRRLDAIADKYHARQEDFRNYVRGEEQKATAEAESKARIDGLTTAFLGNWERTLPSVLKANNVSEDDKADIVDALREAGLAHTGAIPADELSAFMDRIVKREIAKHDRYHRSKSAEYAKVKEADAKRVSPSPSGKAVTAIPAKTEEVDWAENRRLALRAALRSKSA